MRILILGNSGSGKTILASKISKKYRMPHHDLDEIYWRNKEYRRAYSHRRSIRVLRSITLKDSWIIEGAYIHLLKVAVERATSLIWLDLTAEDCVSNAINRDTEMSSFRRSRIEGYYERLGGTSYRSHRDLWERYLGERYTLKSNTENINFLKEGISNVTID